MNHVVRIPADQHPELIDPFACETPEPMSAEEFLILHSTTIQLCTACNVIAATDSALLIAQETGFPLDEVSVFVAQRDALTPEDRLKAFGGSSGSKRRITVRKPPSLASIAENLTDDAVIDGIVNAEEIGFLYGKSAVKKSFIAINACLSVAGGLSFGDFDVEQGSVVYCAGEGQAAIDRRFAAQRHAMDLSESAPVYALSTVPNLMDPEDTRDVVEAILEAVAEEEKPIRLLVIDTLSRAIGGGDNNSNADINLVIDTIQTEIVDRLQCAVVIVAHEGKSENGIMGAYNQFASADFVLKVEASKGGDLSVLKAQKVKDGDDSFELGFSFDVVHVGTTPKGRERTTLISQAVTPQKVKTAAPAKMTDSQNAFLRFAVEQIGASPRLTDGRWKSGDPTPCMLRSELITSFIETRLDGVADSDKPAERRRARVTANDKIDAMISKGRLGVHHGKGKDWLWILA